VPCNDLGARPAAHDPLAHRERGRGILAGRQRPVEPRRDLRAERAARGRPQISERRRGLLGRRERAPGRDDVGAIEALIVEERPRKRGVRRQVRRQQAKPYPHRGEFHRRCRGDPGDERGEAEDMRVPELLLDERVQAHCSDRRDDPPLRQRRAAAQVDPRSRPPAQRCGENDRSADQPGFGEQLQDDVVRGGPDDLVGCEEGRQAGGEGGAGELSPTHAEPRRFGEQPPRERPQGEPRLARHGGEAVERGHADERHHDQRGKRQDRRLARESRPRRPAMVKAECERANPEREQDRAARLRTGARQREERRRAPPPSAPEKVARDEIEQRGLAKRQIPGEQVGLADVPDDARPRRRRDEAAQEARNAVELQDADGRVRERSCQDGPGEDVHHALRAEASGERVPQPRELRGEQHVRDAGNGKLRVGGRAQRGLQCEPAGEQEQPNREIGNGVLVQEPRRKERDHGQRGESGAGPLVVEARQRRPVLGKEKRQRREQRRECERDARGVGQKKAGARPACGIQSARRAYIARQIT